MEKATVNPLFPIFRAIFNTASMDMEALGNEASSKIPKRVTALISLCEKRLLSRSEFSKRIDEIKNKEELRVLAQKISAETSLESYQADDVNSLLDLIDKASKLKEGKQELQYACEKFRLKVGLDHLLDNTEKLMYPDFIESLTKLAQATLSVVKLNFSSAD